MQGWTPGVRVRRRLYAARDRARKRGDQSFECLSVIFRGPADGLFGVPQAKGGVNRPAPRLPHHTGFSCSCTQCTARQLSFGMAVLAEGGKSLSKEASDELIAAGLKQVVMHEIGHTLGLDHCPNYGCLMEDARGTVLTVDREYDLCGDCRQRLVRSGHPLAGADVPIPWPKPE